MVLQVFSNVFLFKVIFNFMKCLLTGYDLDIGYKCNYELVMWFVGDALVLADNTTTSGLAYNSNRDKKAYSCQQ